MPRSESLFVAPDGVTSLVDDLTPFKTMVIDVCSQSRLDDMIARDRFGPVSLELMGGWAPDSREDASMARTLRDVGHYMAGVWSLALAGSREGLSHASLTRLFEPLGLGSRTRVYAMMAYFRARRMIQPSQSGGDGRLKLYDATPTLRNLYRSRFQRELATAADLIPSAGELLARWDEPGLFEGFMVANGQFMTGSYLSITPDIANLDVFAHRNAGLTILGQIMIAATPDEVFPPRGPVELNLRELARLAGVSRAHVRNVVQAGADAGFLLERPDGMIGFSPELRHQLTYLMSAYVLSLEWCADQALRRRPAAPF
jgi:hypothetical protein